MQFQRSAGILLHLTSLPSSGGIGDLGPQAYAFADFLAQARLTLWQILPFSPPGMSNSPYSAISAFAGNPLLISLEQLVARGWITRDCIECQPGWRNRVDFEEARAFKLPLLQKAAQNFLQGGGPEMARFADFKHENAWWLE